MKTTVDLPEDLLMEAKKRAIEDRTTLKELIARALRRELQAPKPKRKKPIRWVTHKGGVAPEADPGDRERFYEWIESRR